MSGYYLFFRLCSNLNDTFPAKKLDEVRDRDLPSALDDLAREWLAQHPGAPAAHQRALLARLREAQSRFLSPAPKGDEDIAESREAEADSLDSLRWACGTHSEQPLICRVALYAGWGHPLPQPLFGGQVVSERFFFARAPDRSTAESALEYIRRLVAKSFGGEWFRPHFGCCAESGFTKEERKTIEITYDLIGLRGDSPSFIQEAQRVLDKVVEVEARVKAAGKRPRITKAEANFRARDALKDRPPGRRKKWSQRTLAKAIGCSATLVHSLPAWQAYHQEKAPDKKSTAPKAVGLTSAVQAVRGQDDAELERLIAEQTADFEESPLVSRTRKQRRRTKL